MQATIAAMPVHHSNWLLTAGYFHNQPLDLRRGILASFAAAWAAAALVTAFRASRL